MNVRYEKSDEIMAYSDGAGRELWYEKFRACNYRWTFPLNLTRGGGAPGTGIPIWMELAER